MLKRQKRKIALALLVSKNIVGKIDIETLRILANAYHDADDSEITENLDELIFIIERYAE